MNFFDLWMIVFLVWSLLRAWFTGVKSQLLGLAGLGLGFIVAEQGVIPRLEQSGLLSLETGGRATLVYLACLFAGRAMGRSADRLTGVKKAGWLDRKVPRSVSLLFAVGQVLIFFNMVYYLFYRYFPAFADELSTSAFMPLVNSLRPFLGGVQLALTSP